VIARAALFALAVLAPGARAGDIAVDAGRGPVDVLVPASYVPSVPAPLVLLLHGQGSNGAEAEFIFQLAPLAESEGFLYVTPTARVGGSGETTWSLTPCCSGGVNNDSFYLRALIDAIDGVLNVDARRVYVVGHSNGGFMAYRLACDHADRLAAIASFAGAVVPALPCPADEPVAVLQMHGTADTTVLYGGGQGYLGAIASTETWAGIDGCSLTYTSAPGFDFDFLVFGAETQVRRYVSSCDPGGAAELWTINGGSHVPWPTAEGRMRLVEFLLDHPKPDGSASFCAGTASLCPCGNGGAAGHGCQNAAGTGGVDLVLSSFAPDGNGGGAAILQGTGFPTTPSLSVIVIRSRTRVDPGAPFGDGLLCLAPPVVRFASAVAQSGSSQHVLLHGAGAGTFHYQLWYRSQPTSYCDPAAGFNLSDGLTLVW
jgi:polyhydroxybutyrate depolymerase